MNIELGGGRQWNSESGSEREDTHSVRGGVLNPLLIQLNALSDIE